MTLFIFPNFSAISSETREILDKRFELQFKTEIFKGYFNTNSLRLSCSYSKWLMQLTKAVSRGC